MDISADIQKQTAACEEIANRLQIVSCITEVVEEKTLKTGKAFYDITKQDNQFEVNRIVCLWQPTANKMNQQADSLVIN